MFGLPTAHAADSRSQARTRAGVRLLSGAFGSLGFFGSRGFFGGFGFRRRPPRGTPFYEHAIDL